MLFNASERKGVIVILSLLLGILIIPRQILSHNHRLYLLPVAEHVPGDSVDLLDTVKIVSQSFDGNKIKPRKQSIELNTVDSAGLVKVRGIGPFYASRIIRYRERLGGYYSVKQLKELKMKYFNVDSCASLFTVDQSLILKSDLDTMSFKAILKHPYLEYEDVQMIYNAKRKYGHLSYAVLEEHKVLAPHKLKKMKPYFQ